MKFGVQSGKQLSGAGLYVILMQAASLLPLPYFLTVSGYLGVITKRGVLPFLFDAGFAALPRWESLLLSLLYRNTAHELLVCFVLLAAALAFGIIMKRLLQNEGKTAVVLRTVLCGLIAADLLLRLALPGFRTAFGMPAAVVGLVIRLAMLGLLIGDLIAEKNHSQHGVLRR